jgi:signal transduction histidine kinase
MRERARGRGPWVAAALALAALCAGEALIRRDVPDSVLILAAALAYGMGAYGSPRPGAVAAGGLLALLLAVSIADDGVWVPQTFSVVGPWLAGRAVRSRGLLVAALERQARELAAEEEALARLAVRRERARIARELHDIVSHSLALMVVQAGAGRMAAPEPGDGAARRFATIRDAGERALAEMQRLADVLGTERDDETGPQRLHRVLADARGAGLRVRAALPAELALPPELDDVLHRIVQEGVTNALKHAPGAELELRVDLRDDELAVELRDSGAAPHATLARSGSGLGLGGLRERVADAGGELEAAPAPGGGWRLRARLPVPVAAAVATPQG